MKKIYRIKHDTMIVGIHTDFQENWNSWRDQRLFYLDETEAGIKIEHFPTYEALAERKGAISNSLELSVDRVKPYTITAKKYKGVTFRVRFEEVSRYSIQDLAEHLQAQDFIAFCIDHGYNIFQEISQNLLTNT